MSALDDRSQRLADRRHAEAGVTHKCLVPIGGRPLLAHVLSALGDVGDIGSIHISVEDGAADRLRPVAALSGLPVGFVTAADRRTYDIAAELLDRRAA